MVAASVGAHSSNGHFDKGTMPGWMAALQEYKKQTGQYVIPKKGSDAYLAVKAIELRLNKEKAEAFLKQHPDTPEEKPSEEPVVDEVAVDMVEESADKKE